MGEESEHRLEETPSSALLLRKYLVKVEGEHADRVEHHCRLLHPRVYQDLEEQNLKAVDTAVLGAVQAWWKIPSQLLGKWRSFHRYCPVPPTPLWPLHPSCRTNRGQEAP